MSRIAQILAGIEPGPTPDWFAQHGHTVDEVDTTAEISQDADLVLVIADEDESTGLGVLRAIRKRDLGSPIIVLGPPPPGDSPSRYLASGATDHIRWPAAGADLAIRLGAHIERTSGRVASRALERAEQALFLQGRLFDQLLHVSPEPIIVADQRGRVMHFNAAAQKLLGYNAEDAVRQCHASDFYMDPNDRGQLIEAIDEAPDNCVPGMALRLRARNGDIIPVRAWASGLRNEGGDLLATATIFRDLREQISLSSRLEEATKQLIHVEKKAATAAVAGATAHELNQPLTVAMGLLEILAVQSPVNEDMKERIDQVYHQLDRIAEIVRQLSSVTRFRTTNYVGGEEILDLDTD